MNFFQRLFKREKPTVECPRCLGKGHVDTNDIKRLGKELIWGPGKCAYCNGIGKVRPDQIGKAAADEGYLVTTLSRAERRRILDGDPAALKRAQEWNMNINQTVRQILTLHLVQKLSAEEIAELFVESNPRTNRGRERKKEKGARKICRPRNNSCQITY